ncbi:MAG TPA: (2Fe-2S)-binding protein [Pirellulales bacterium]|jgi:bacterioferritin-associated ferredoxin|nr:(2Fe-2S)-binding protein [Pirellulales bacterium]
MQLDDEVCLCFHVTKRKLLNFLRVERPRREGQMSDCFGAGTGCGWCRTYLRHMFREAVAGGTTTEADVSPEEYARRRADYIRAGHGTPPTEAQNDE